MGDEYNCSLSFFSAHLPFLPETKIKYVFMSGWMMWNWMVTALALGTTLVLYDGSPLHPHPGALWDLVINCQVCERILVANVDLDVPFNILCIFLAKKYT